MSEYELINVLDSTYGAYVVKGAYSGNKNQRGTSNHSDAVATIREMMNGNTADVRLSAKEASTSVSTVQKLANAADTIADKLSKMKELATKAASPDYSQVKIEEMQKEFKNLAEEINETAKSTEHENNKIFTATGQSISIPVGDGSKSDIFAKDLSFKAENLNISTDAQTALSDVNKAIEDINEYNEHLNKQRIRIENAAATIESEMESAMGIDLDDFTLVIATEITSYTGNQLTKDDGASFNTQANFTPAEVIKLLESNN